MYVLILIRSGLLSGSQNKRFGPFWWSQDTLKGTLKPTRTGILTESGSTARIAIARQKVECLVLDFYKKKNKKKNNEYFIDYL